MIQLDEGKEMVVRTLLCTWMEREGEEEEEVLGIVFLLLPSRIFPAWRVL